MVNIKFETPDDFFQLIPTEPVKNVEFRKELHTLLCKDEKWKKVYLEMCWVKPQIMFNSAFFTYNPRKPVGLRNVPFILRPKQVEGITCLKRAIDCGHNIVFDKSRDEGATEIICKLFIVYWLLCPDSSFLIGSRKEEFVDKSTELINGRIVGTHKCLFHKLLYALYSIPEYLRPAFSKTHLQLINLENNSGINGESTNESFGAGDRATAVLVDELARIEPTIAQSIIENINDVSNCCIYNSTQFKWGAAHPFNKLLKEGKIEKFILGWETNPTKNEGFYKSNKKGEIQIIDLEYYHQKYPGVFDQVSKEDSIKIIDIDWKDYKPYNFIGDGGDTNFNSPRSIWFDKEEKRRNKRDLCQNVLRIAAGSSDRVFDFALIARIRNADKAEPTTMFDVKYDVVDTKVTNVKVKPSASVNAVKWWGDLIKGRPNQEHNYIVACDISRGTGASNSVAAIVDVNMCELVGLYVNPNIDVADFAEQVYALCKWIGGGTKESFLIWEANGVGETFGKHIIKLGYRFIYYDTNEKGRHPKKSKKVGWYSSRGLNGSKISLLNELSGALLERFRPDSKFTSIKVHDEQFINELESYVFFEGNIDVGLAAAQLETSGAKYAHGDRVIAVGLAVLAMKHQPKAVIKIQQNYQPGTYGYRLEKAKELAELEKKSKQYLY